MNDLFVYLNIRKEAQKCFCEASNCRGWIGETPEEEKEKIEKKEKREKDIKKKKEEKKPADYMEDEDVSIAQWILVKRYIPVILSSLFITLFFCVSF